MYYVCVYKQYNNYRADSRLAPSQWETVLLCNDVSHWLDASLESALNYAITVMLHEHYGISNYSLTVCSTACPPIDWQRNINSLITGPLWGDCISIQWILPRRASNTESVSMSYHHHVYTIWVILVTWRIACWLYPFWYHIGRSHYANDHPPHGTEITSPGLKEFLLFHNVVVVPG